MKKGTFCSMLMLIVLTLPMMVACGGDDDNKGPSKEEQNEINQEKEFNLMKAELIGEWEAYQAYNNTNYGQQGWRPIESISWSTTGYTFNSDGTYIQHVTYSEDKISKYYLEKNPNYSSDPHHNCSIYFCYDEYNTSKYSKRCIWFDNEGYLRLGESAKFDTGIPSDYNCDGESGIRYKKVK